MVAQLTDRNTELVGDRGVKYADIGMRVIGFEEQPLGRDAGEGIEGFGGAKSGWSERNIVTLRDDVIGL